MSKKLRIVLVVILVALGGCATKSKDVTNQSFVVFGETAQLVPVGLAGVNEKVSILVLFQENREKLHGLKLCLCNFQKGECRLIDWQETELHPSDARFPGLVNKLWLQEYPESELRFKEAKLYPEPIGYLEVEAIYYPHVVLKK